MKINCGSCFEARKELPISQQLVNRRNIMIQFIEKQGATFCFVINNQKYHLIKYNLYQEKAFIPLAAKVKGSTLGWYIQRQFVSYNQLKKAVANVVATL